MSYCIAENCITYLQNVCFQLAGKHYLMPKNDIEGNHFF